MDGGIRRLSALLLTDMVGYVSLTQQDERLALRLLEEHRHVVEPVFDRNSGRVIKTIGDAYLVEFESALDAVNCGIDLQRVLHEAERTRPEESVRVRIGVHVGDVLHRSGDVFGDTVNLLSRLTPLAEPGGLCLTQPVVDQVRNRIEYPCRPIDLPPLRNVEFPLMAYRVELPWLEEGSSHRTPWTDRRAEVEMLERAISRALNGYPEAVVISGEAGVGKTRLAEEAVRRAHEHGFRVLRGGFFNELSAPYSAWASALREFVTEAPVQLLYRVCGNYAGELSKLVPELTERVGPTPAPTDGELGEGRRRLFEGVAHLLQSLSREAAMLVFLDDLQNADPASLDLLKYILRSWRTERVLLLASYRDTEVEEDSPLRQTLADLARDRTVADLRVTRLDRESVGRMVEAIYDGPAGVAELADAVYDKTGGNPFFVEELVRSLREPRGLGTASVRRSVEGQPWPDTVRRVLRQRLLRLPPETVRLLGVAAVVGPVFRFDVLREVADVDEEVLLAALEKALKGRVLSEQREAHGPAHYGFVDRQTREILCADLSQVRARKYHQRAATALETAYGAQAKVHAEELAYHFLEGDIPEKALDYSLTAAERAVSVYARDAAIRHYRTALDLLEEREEPARQAAVLEALGEQEGYQGEMMECRGHLDEAARQFEVAGDRMGAARALIKAAHIHRLGFYDAATASVRVARARSLLEGAAESPELATLMNELASELPAAPDSTAAREALEAALSVAERTGAGDLVTMIRLHLAGSVPLDQVDASFREVVETLGPRASTAADPNLVRAYYTTLTEFQVEVYGDAAAAVRDLERAVRLLRERGATATAMDLAGQDLAATHVVLGNLVEARRLAEETFAYARRNYPTPDAPNLAVLGELARLRGEFSESHRLLGLASDLFARSGPGGYGYWGDTFVVRAYLDEGAFDAAAKFADDSLARLEGKATVPTFVSTECRLLELAIRAHIGRGHLPEAVRYLGWLRDLATRVDRSTTLGYLWRAEGALARVDGRPREAMDELRRSAETWERIGWRCEELESREMLAAAAEAAGEAEGAKSAVSRTRALRLEVGLAERAERTEKAARSEPIAVG